MPTLILRHCKGGDSWIEGAAIMAAVAVVVLVTAVNNFQKEAQFRELNKLNEDTQVGQRRRCPAPLPGIAANLCTGLLDHIATC